MHCWAPTIIFQRTEMRDCTHACTMPVPRWWIAPWDCWWPQCHTGRVWRTHDSPLQWARRPDDQKLSTCCWDWSAWRCLCGRCLTPRVLPSHLKEMKKKAQAAEGNPWQPRQALALEQASLQSTWSCWRHKWLPSYPSWKSGYTPHFRPSSDLASVDGNLTTFHWSHGASITSRHHIGAWDQLSSGYSNVLLSPLVEEQCLFENRGSPSAKEMAKSRPSACHQHTHKDVARNVSHGRPWPFWI